MLARFKQFAREQINLELYLIAFLEQRFTNPRFYSLLDTTLIEAIQNLDNDSQKILKLRYSQKMNVADIARILSRQNSSNPQEIDFLLAKAKNKIQKRLLEQLVSGEQSLSGYG